MSHIYTIATDGTAITLTLTRGHHFIAEVSARPESGTHDLIKTAATWCNEYDATPEIAGTQELWDNLPTLFWQTLDELLAPTTVSA